MSLLEDINILFNNIHKYEASLQEAKLSKNILKYSDKSPEELKKLLKDSENCCITPGNFWRVVIQKTTCILCSRPADDIRF